MRQALLAFALMLAAAAPAAAQGGVPGGVQGGADVPTTGPALQKRLEHYDPKAVAAARHYYTQPAIKAGMVAMTDNMNTAMSNILAQQNPNLSPQQLEAARKAIGEATRDRLDLIMQMSMIVALDTLSTDELVALDNFYSSPVGASIIAKMPKMTRALPAMMQTIMPDYMNDVKARLKGTGAELKL